MDLYKPVGATSCGAPVVRYVKFVVVYLIGVGRGLRNPKNSLRSFPGTLGLLPPKPSLVREGGRRSLTDE